MILGKYSEEQNSVIATENLYAVEYYSTFYRKVSTSAVSLHYEFIDILVLIVKSRNRRQ